MSKALFSDAEPTATTTEATAADIAKYLTDDFEEETPEKPPATPVDAEPADEDEAGDEEEQGEEQEAAGKVPEEAEKAPPAPAPTAKPEAKPEPPKEPMFTQAQVNAILAQDKRLARELESVTGKNLQQLIADQRTAAVTETADKYGMTEAEAQQYIEAQQKVRLLEAEQVRSRQEALAQQVAYARRAAYQGAQAKYANDPDARIIAEHTDALAQGGLAAIGHDDALFYSFGKQWFTGGLRETYRVNVEQQTLSNVEKRSKTKVESGGAQATRTPDVRLEGTEKRFAHIFLGDLTDKPEMAYNQAKRK